MHQGIWTFLDAHSYFFFFQAEDGIRDLTVTGVQTCALPISYGSPCGFRSPRTAAVRLSAGAPSCWRTSGSRWWRRTRASRRRRPWSRTPRKRSEERRVGEEGRSRWSPYHLKKKKKIVL